MKELSEARLGKGVYFGAGRAMLSLFRYSSSFFYLTSKKASFQPSTPKVLNQQNQD